MRLLASLIFICSFSFGYSQLLSTHKFPPSGLSTSAMCNEAGTIQVGPFIGQSNDGVVPQIFLCKNDLIQIVHNGDFSIMGDPDPTTPFGIGYAIYRPSPPTINGPTVTDIRFDPNLITNISGEIYLVRGEANGNATISNTGVWNSNPDFGGGTPSVPVTLNFAPITLFNFDDVDAWDGNGYCVDVNIDEAFEVVFLNPLQARNLEQLEPNSCLFEYRPYGGFYQFDNSSTYDISIENVDNPSVDVIYLNEFNAGAGSNPLFASVTEPGTYHLSIEDGKSCSVHELIDMSGCELNNSVHISTPTMTAEKGSIVCVPIEIDFDEDISSFTLSVTFDETVLKFRSATQDNSDVLLIPNLNEVSIGRFGVGLSPFSISSPMPLNPQDTLFEVCFEVIGDVGECSPIGFSGVPTKIEALPFTGLSQLAFTRTEGSVCVDEASSTSNFINEEKIQLYPNPVSDILQVTVKDVDVQSIQLIDQFGKVILEKKLLQSEELLSLDVNDIVSGTFFLKIESLSGKTSLQKVEVLH